MRAHVALVRLLVVIPMLGISSTLRAQCEIDRPGVGDARGTVFVDTNRNGRLDLGERGVDGVHVSNGCRVVQTDHRGRYRIDIAPTEILFVTKPAAYSLPLDEHNIPQFFYRHYPTGTPTVVDGASVEWEFPVIEPTGPLPASIDFPLLAHPAASPEFKAHGFADPQARTDLGEDMLREDLINPLIGNPYGVLFGLTVGDVANDNLAIYDRHKRMMALMDVPQWYLPGNHDMNFESPNAFYANETYKLHFGPTYYSFDEGHVHFVALNNVEYAGAGQEFEEDNYRGVINDVQLRWLKNDLATVPKDKLLVIATHIPLIAVASDGVSPPTTGPDTQNFDELLEILKPFEFVYGLAGHDTSNSWKVEVNHRHGWTGRPWIAHTLAEVRGNGWTTGPPDLRGVRDATMQDGNPNGFYVLKFNDVELIPEFVPFPFGPDAAERLRITLDPRLAAPPSGSVNRGALRAGTKLVVNLFDGGARDKVWMSLDGGARQLMSYTVRTDPYVERIRKRYAQTEDAYGAATLSAHIWEHPLPDTLSPGLHHVIVTSEDEFGQTRRATFSFEIIAGDPRR